MESKSTSHIYIKHPKLFGFGAFLLLLIPISFIVHFRYNTVKENHEREMNNLLIVVQQNIQNIIRNSNTALIPLALSIDEIENIDDFNNIAKKIKDKNKFIDVLQLSPNGVIKYVYPLKGNEAVLNYDVLNTNIIKDDALRAIKNKQFFFAGPFKLKQGGIGIVGRLPIFKKNQFCGFAGAMIRIETFLEYSGINTIDKSKYYFQFSKVNDLTTIEEFFLPIENSHNTSNSISLNILDSNWKISIIPIQKYYIYSQILPSALLGLFLAGICGFLVYILSFKRRELENIIHNQAVNLLNSELVFKTIFDQAPVGIVKINPDTGNYIEVNKQYCKLLGYTEEEIKDINFIQITHNEDLKVELDLMNQLKKGEISEFKIEKRYYDKYDNLKWANVTVSPIWKNKETLEYIKIIEDITEQKKSEISLQKSYDLVLDQNKRLLNFSYIVSHNLRSHTANIESIINFIQLAKTEEERNEMIELLKSVSTSLNETLSHLNEVVSIRSNVNLNIENINLNNYIIKVTNILKDVVAKKNARIINNIPDDLIISYNPSYLESILYNFISNALKYSHPERNPIIKIDFDKEKKLLSIEDNGIGIDLEKNGQNLFGMYKTFTNNSDSRGIGLFLTKNQIDAMGGYVEVKSELNKGTTFTIFIK